MKIIKILFVTTIIFSNVTWASGGDDSGNGGNNFLDRSPVFQYTCLYFGGKTTTDGKIERTSYARNFFRYLDEELPDPILGQSMFFCHDFQRYGEVDSAEYPRLETKETYSLFNRFDARMQTGPGGRKKVDLLIEKKLQDDYGIGYTSDLFWKNEIGGSNYGYILRPFWDNSTNRVYCPNLENINVSPLDKVVAEFTGDTEGLYYAIVEKQMIVIGPNTQVINAELYVSETNLLKYGFYLRDGVKTRVTNDSTLELKTVFFYYPFSDNADPLIKGSRKLATIKFPNSNSFTKKLGCIHKNK